MEKGAIFSLDFLLSVVLVMLAVGLVMKTLELTTYSQKEEILNQELKKVAENTGNVFVSDPSINCNVTELSIKLMNCIDTTVLPSITNWRKEVGLPDDFDAAIVGLGPPASVPPILIGGAGMTILYDPITGEIVGQDPEPDNFEEVKRAIVTRSVVPNTIAKGEYNNKTLLATNSIERVVTIRVWRK